MDKKLQLSKNSFFRLKITSLYFLIFFLLFFVFRTALFLSSYIFFKELPYMSILSSFFIGLRFDAVPIATFCGIFFFLQNIPVNSKLFVKINIAFLNLFLLLFGFLLAADVVYFKLFLKHLTTEPLLIKSHFDYFINLAFGNYIFATISILLFTVAVCYFSFKIIDKYYKKPYTGFAFNTAILALLCILIVVGVRGGWQRVILQINDAYTNGRLDGELKLNAVFTSLISIRSMTAYNEIDISHQDSIETVKDNLLDFKEEVFPNENFPFMRQRVTVNVNGKNYNVVFILLESWQKEYIDSFSGTSYGVTPNFDAIAKESIMFDNFYANGQRSIMGLMSIFFSFSYVQGMPYLGLGLESYGQTRLPVILYKNGYDNVYVQGDARESDNGVALAYYLGFKEAYGKQDISFRHKYEQINKGYDLEGLEFFFEKIRMLENPFFAFYFTTTTHIPYAKTILKELEKYPEDGTEKTGYLNRLYYADYSLGEFFNKAKKEKWFNNTIFIMCSDHQAYGVGGANASLEKTKVDRTFKIPAVIYCPSLFKAEKNKVLASQVDIVPTIIDMLNINIPYSSLGKSLFSKDKNRFVFLSYEGEQIYLINTNGVFERDWKVDLNKKLDYSNLNEKLLFSVEKAVYNLVSQDKWYDRKILD
jgi:phosphoglycerol transferase MdoB-like AlkP superfamily enzyme